MRLYRETWVLSLSSGVTNGPCWNLGFFENMLLFLSDFFAIVCNIDFLHSSRTAD